MLYSYFIVFVLLLIRRFTALCLLFYKCIIITFAPFLLTRRYTIHQPTPSFSSFHFPFMKVTFLCKAQLVCLSTAVWLHPPLSLSPTSCFCFGVIAVHYSSSHRQHTIKGQGRVTSAHEDYILVPSLRSPRVMKTATVSHNNITIQNLCLL
jgi:hypothetical protein